MSLPQARLTPEEYLAVERQAGFKSEYLDGQMFALAGANEWHTLIVTNVVAELRQHFKGRPCKVYAQDMRIKVKATGLYTYPDVSALCGEAFFLDEHRDTLLNPSLIVEVLSDSTEAYDRGRKFAHYRTVESLSDYVLIAQDHMRIEHYSRQSDGRWLLTEKRLPEQSVDLASLGCQLSLSETYDKVELRSS